MELQVVVAAKTSLALELLDNDLKFIKKTHVRGIIKETEFTIRKPSINSHCTLGVSMKSQQLNCTTIALIPVLTITRNVHSPIPRRVHQSPCALSTQDPLYFVEYPEEAVCTAKPGARSCGGGLTGARRRTRHRGLS